MSESLWQRVRRFCQRHMGKVVIGAVAVPLFIRLTRFTARKYLEYQTRRTHEMVRRYKKQQMFEMMEENLATTFRQWYEVMKQTIGEQLNAALYTERLRHGAGNKLDNWTELKTIAFASVLALVYGSSMLIVLIRIQVHVISGLLFKQTDENPPGLEDFEEENDFGGGGDAPIRLSHRDCIITDALQQEYMILTRHLCTDGIALLCQSLQENSRNVTGNLSLKKTVTVTNVQSILNKIMSNQTDRPETDLRHFKDTDSGDWCPIKESWQYMFSREMKQRFLYYPEEHVRQKSAHEAFLRTLVGEAFDVVNSEDTKKILKFLEAQGISHYLDLLAEEMAKIHNDNDPSPNSSENQGNNENENENGTNSPYEDGLEDEPSAPIAKIIPVLNSFINIPFAEDTWAAILLQNDTLKTFSANIYESYSANGVCIPPVPSARH